MSSKMRIEILEDVSRKVIIFLYAEPAADLTRRASQLHQCAVQIEYSDTLLEVNYGYSSRNIRYCVSSLGQVAGRGCRAARTKPPGGPVLKSLLWRVPKKTPKKPHNQKNKPRCYGIGNAISDSVRVASHLSFSMTFFFYISNYSQAYFPRLQ